MKKTLQKSILGITSFIIAFALSYGGGIGKISPFGIAFANSMTDKLWPAGFVGSALGYILTSSDDIMPIRYIATLFIIAVIRGALKEIFDKDNPLYTAGITAFSCLVTGFTILISTSFSLTAVLLYIIEALLAAGLSFFFREFQTAENREDIENEEDIQFTDDAISQKLNSVGSTIIRISGLMKKVSAKTDNMFPEDVQAAQMRGIISKQIEDSGNLVLSLADKVSSGALLQGEDIKCNPVFDVSLGTHQISAKCNHRSGDYFTSFYTESGKFIIILSDGMGTGSVAALGSAISVEILAGLLKEDIDFSCAINLTNSAVMATSGDESLATIDIACIDLKTGQADFYKAGAAATLVRHGRRIVKLDRVALPIGILGNVEFSHATATLSEYDIVLMSSDGIWIGDEVRIARQLSYFRGTSMESLAQKIADTAFESETITDDITVIAAQLLPLKSL